MKSTQELLPFKLTQKNPRIKTTLKIGCIAGLLCLCPSLAQAHSSGGMLNGWHDGFNHPLHGWDHLLAMLAVGLWAAQQRGRAAWLFPLTFIGMMCVGGLVGMVGPNLPEGEVAIFLSVIVFGCLVIGRVRLRPWAGMMIIGFFAFFHGFAHGREMPESLSVVSFGSGLMLATALLHAAGYIAARVVVMGLACLVGTSALAVEATNAPASNTDTNSAAKPAEPVRLPEMVVKGRADSMIGIAESATQGTTGAAQLAERPILRSGEILETVPGVIITQHAGGGKANQYFLRGFNLDHGTDFAVFLDGMPLNLPTHAHGEGYADMNVVIPEFVQRVNYEKGPYYADVGNYGSAGSAHLVFYQTLPQNFVTAEAGMYGFARAVFGVSQELGTGNILYGGEAYHDDGPWEIPDDYQKFNGIVTYSQGDASTGWSATFRAYHGTWHSSDQVAALAVDRGVVPFFGSLNNSTGGNSQRYSLQAEWHRQDENSETKVTVYGFYYDLDLFSDFTYWLTDTNRGDQFEQQDSRWVGGLDAHHTLFNHWFGRDVENTFGLQVRYDSIDVGLYQTENRTRVDKFDSDSGTSLPATTQKDQLSDVQGGLYYENKIQWAEKFRSVAAVRGDWQYFDVDSQSDPTNNSGTSSYFLASPKLSLIFGPWDKTEYYVQGGFSFHSNDGRGTTQNVQPVSAENPYPGTPSTKIPGLVQTYGAEVGVRTLIVPKLQSTLSLWYLHSDSELMQAGDTGGTVASKQPSNRYGVEWANYYSLTKYLAFDFDGAYSIARFTETDPGDAAPGHTGGDHVPEAVQWVVSSGVTLHDYYGFSASLRLRYFGPRDLTSDGIYQSSDTILLNAQVSYQINKTWRVSAEVLNLLDRRDHDIDYAYEYRITPASASDFGDVYHPVEPIQARFALTARF